MILGNAPLFHILGQTCGLATLLVGGTLILQPKINLDAALEAIQRFKGQNYDRCSHPVPHDFRA